MFPNGRKLEGLRNKIFTKELTTQLKSVLDQFKIPNFYVGVKLSNFNEYNPPNRNNFMVRPIFSQPSFFLGTERQNNPLAGTVKTHPQFISSNGQPLPIDKNLIERLFKESLPEHLRSYANLGILSRYEIPEVDGRKAGRFAPSDEMVENKTRFALDKGWISPERDLVVMNNGGPHSIATARALAQRGYFVIPHFNSKNGVSNEQRVATLAFFVYELTELNKITKQNNPNAPWALILDGHRDYRLEEKDLPPIPSNYRLVIVTEGEDLLLPRQLHTSHPEYPVFTSLFKASDLLHARFDPYSVLDEEKKR
ncbi:hypothetical protein A2276_03990 [candidate division WOR-1 bacterium RIFOXYA12_FULL_43_27]|uniref:Uncharacterized protein n=1 Tax=candidate division WOR-1 bacterium RIFOXYC2_FULL_46_14 TaxID=1802587 RepID=A0A1F4U782_UNCSA|nr:MAG: hypothetical protein A2276_03990 [candidate division WOR-1 bacterium RIFOXYA12_FULL_43_27]OGC19149.1 MAG: hypothetical protein A2292_00345 [candidate division WOR-1 bacterium RIFOXYB2_FULL_46_45]OGC30137.1 MAG: hypothetical protein A2232_00345 [candidate division WOR-1 bacterium RIFOXYA2_FULL_46_56]OGC40739.1 MAG: hypothetical protein A2438_00350 [candidate division WOR-1 bacterium RIFOXYC2_FULL_46_14]